MLNEILIIFYYVKGDVYPVERYENFTVSQVLDAHWGVLDDEDVSSISDLISKAY